MNWTMVSIRQLDDDGGGVMYPVPTGTVNGIEFEPSDGTDISTVHATAITVTRVSDGQRKRLLFAKEIKATVYITDSRVAVACTKFDKGGGWWGGATAIALNAASKARAAVRRRGKCLVGQVRYPWVSVIGYRTKTGWTSSEQIRLLTKLSSDGAILMMDLTLPKSTSAEKVAMDIVRRTAHFRLQEPELGEAERAGLIDLADPAPLPAEKDAFSTWRFPSHWFPSAGSAYGKRSDLGVATSEVTSWAQ